MRGIDDFDTGELVLAAQCLQPRRGRLLVARQSVHQQRQSHAYSWSHKSDGVEHALLGSAGPIITFQADLRFSVQQCGLILGLGEQGPQRGCIA